MDSSNTESKAPVEEETVEGGLSLELLAEIANNVPDLDIDFPSTKQTFLTGLERTLPMAPIVNHMRGGAHAPVLRGVGAPPQGIQQQGAPQGGHGVQGGNPVQGQQPQGQGRGPPPPPQRYAWEDDDIVSGTGDNSQQTMLC